MKKIIDLIMGGIIFVIFIPLGVIAILLAIISNIPKFENTFLFGIFKWVNTLLAGAKSPWTLKKRMYLVLAGFISIVLWAIILFVIM